jgi:hypothetical protein
MNASAGGPLNNKIPVKLTSVNFETLAGFSRGKIRFFYNHFICSSELGSQFCFTTCCACVLQDGSAPINGNIGGVSGSSLTVRSPRKCEAVLFSVHLE